jgi:hypothetical protein
MDIILMPEAERALLKLAFYLENINTPGSGDRYLEKLYSHIEKYALENVAYKKCNDERLFLLQYSCLNFNNWIIAFKIEDGNFNIYEIIWGPILQ